MPASAQKLLYTGVAKLTINIYQKQTYYQEYLDEKGISLNDHFDISDIQMQIDLDSDAFIAFANANRENALTKWYGPRPFYNFDSMREAVFLNSLGYNEHNTFEYNWGIEDHHNDALKNMLGDDAFDTLRIDRDTAGLRLLQYNPGQGIPMHTDSFNSFRTKHNIAENNGSIKRYFIAVSPWDWGHFLQVHDNMIHHWTPGYVLEIPNGVFHLSANFGIAPKYSLTVTGYRP